MKDNISQQFELLKTDYPVFLNFLKAKFPLFHNSNFFYRDLQYGIRKFFEKKGIKLSYPDSEILTKEFSKFLEEKEIFINVNSNGWKINYPEFVTSEPGDPF